ncbi:hypothetical protein BDY19DRAFT_879025 [Irpex rosettiformis]|uniref:Uncharacterized protein n=1 Tax=Irpex rosettiformis TaxID=378272 RepID=A0ACB8ULH3_9APHY|nr:hypothetical protein BDY19DRAFT_879025 [Irpex rosettiformis]
MLWRASQVFRHFPPANLLRFRSRESVVIAPTWQSIRCGSAAIAVQVRAVTRQPSTSTYQDHKQQAQRASKLPSQTLQRCLVATLPQPEQELVDIVDRLYARRREGENLEKYVESPELLGHLRDRKKATELAALMVNTSVPHRALRVLILAHELGCKFTQSVYERIAYQLAQTRQWSEVPALVSLGQMQSGKTTIRLLNWRTRALVEVAQYRLLDNVLSDFEQAHIQPNRRTFNTLVSGHLRNHDLEKAQDCLEWMQDAGFPMDASTHALLTAGYRSFGPDQRVKERALAHIPKMKAKDGSMVVNSLLQVAVDTDDTAGIRRFVSFFDGPLGVAGREVDSELDFPHTVGVKSQLSNHGRKATRPGGDLYPDIVTFTILVNYGAKAKDYDFAMQMIQRMKSYGIEPDSYFVAALIRLHGFTGHFSVALDISATLCHDDTPLALRRLRQLGWQGDFYPDLKASPVRHSHHTVNALLKVALPTVGLKGLRIVSHFMYALGLKHNEYTVETFLGYLSRSSRIRPRDLLQILRALSKDIAPTLRQLNIVFSALIRQRRAQSLPSGWNSLAHQLRPIREDGQRHTPPAADDQQQTSSDSARSTTDKTGAAVSSSRLSYRELMMPILTSLDKRRVLPDGEMTKNRILFDGVVTGNIELAKSHFQLMLERGIHPTKYHYSALIESYCRAGEMGEAIRTLASARKAGFADDPVMYTLIINGYARLCQPLHAARMFRKMLAYRIRPDVAAVDALARAYYAAGHPRKARSILQWYWPFFGRLSPEIHHAPLKTIAKEFRALGQARQNPFADRDDERKSVARISSEWQWKESESRCGKGNQTRSLRGRVGRGVSLSSRGRMIYRMYLSESKPSR